MYELRLIRPVFNARLRDGKGGKMKQITAEGWTKFEAIPAAAAVDENIEIREVAKIAKEQAPAPAKERPSLSKKTKAKKSAKKAEG